MKILTFKLKILAMFILNFVVTTVLYAQTGVDCSTAIPVTLGVAQTGNNDVNSFPDGVHYSYSPPSTGDYKFTFTISDGSSIIDFFVYKLDDICDDLSADPDNPVGPWASTGDGAEQTLQLETGKVYLFKAVEAINYTAIDYSFTVTALAPPVTVTPGGVNDMPTVWYKPSGFVIGGAFNNKVTGWYNNGSLTLYQAAPAGHEPLHGTGSLFNNNPYATFLGGGGPSDENYLTGTLTADPLSAGGGTHFVVFNEINNADVALYVFPDETATATRGVGRGAFHQDGFAYEFDAEVPTNETQTTMLSAKIETSGSGGNFAVQKDGSSITKTPTGSYTARASSGSFTIGKYDGNYTNSHLAEIIVFNTLLSDLDIQRVNSYLAIKYGIPLGDNTSPKDYYASDGTSKVWDITANSGYLSDVFGIGKDEKTGLDQAQSVSRNSGVISLSGASSLNFGDYLLLGHDNGALSAQYSDLPSSVTQSRLVREWKADLTGDPGTVTLAVDLTGITLGGTIGTATTDFNILIDSDGNGDFSNATAINPSTVSGTLLTFNALTIPDGAVFTFTAQLTKTWDGSEGTPWATVNNWALGVSPDASGFDHVVIADVANDPVIPNNGQISVKNLTIDASATLTISSDATSTGSLKIDGTLTNNGTITSQHYLKGAAQAWHMVGAPMAGGITANGWNPTTGQDDFYAWDEPTPGTWVNYDNTGTPSFTTVNGSMDFVPGKGYLVAYNAANPTKTFVGTLTTGSVNFPLKRTSAKAWTYSSGWNLLGNPYSSAIDWNLATRTQFEDNFVYAYDPNKDGGEGYVNIDGTQANAFIAPHQAFFVRATQSANNQNFTFTNAIQTHGGTNYKSATAQPASITLRLANESNYDETRIRLMSESEANRDRNDAVKMYSFNPAIPQLYSLSQDDAPLAVNSHAEILTEQPIRLGMKLPAAGNYTLSLEQADAQLAGNGLFVEDTQSGLLHKLSDNPFVFSASEGDISNRWVLHFGLVGQPEVMEQKPFVVYQSGNRLYFQSNSSFETITVFDLSGRLIHSQQLGAAQLQAISLKAAQSGVYVVKASGSDGVYSRKVVLVNK